MALGADYFTDAQRLGQNSGPLSGHRVRDRSGAVCIGESDG